MSTVAYEITCSHPGCAATHSELFGYDLCARVPEPNIPADWTMIDGEPVCAAHTPTVTAEEAAALKAKNDAMGVKVAELEATVDRMVRERL